MRKNSFFVLLLLCSCMSRNESPELTSEVTLKKTVTEAEASGLFAGGDYPEANWYEEFKDDCLTCLVNEALGNNPGLDGMKKRVEVANQAALMTRSALYPQLSTLFQYAYLYLTDAHFLQELLPDAKNSSFLYNLMFNFSYEFDFWGKNKKKYKAALGTMHATKMQYEQSKLILTTSVTKSYFNLMAMRAKKEVLEQLLARKEKFLNLVRLRRKNRIDSKINQYDFTQKVKTVEESLIAISKEILLEESLINILCGRTPEEEVKTLPLYDAPDYKLELPENITSTLLSRRPDLLAQLWMVKKSALDIGVAFTEFLPDVSILDGPAFVSNKLSKFLDPNTFANVLFPEISQPLFTGKRLLSNWRKSKAAYDQSVCEFNNMFLEAARDVRDRIISYIENEEQETVQKHKLELSKTNYELEFLKFSHGVSSMLDVIEYDEIYLENKAVMIERDRTKKISYVDFIQSLGGGFKGSDEDIEE